MSRSYADDGELTPRMRDVLRAAARGANERETAGELCIAPGTVKSVRAAVLVRLGARNIVEAVAIAYRTGVL
jgi:DNA-binding NarL/FixJ family response regulator